MNSFNNIMRDFNDFKKTPQVFNGCFTTVGTESKR